MWDMLKQLINMLLWAVVAYFTYMWVTSAASEATEFANIFKF